MYFFFPIFEYESKYFKEIPNFRSLFQGKYLLIPGSKIFKSFSKGRSKIASKRSIRLILIHSVDMTCAGQAMFQNARFFWYDTLHTMLSHCAQPRVPVGSCISEFIRNSQITSLSYLASNICIQLSSTTTLLLSILLSTKSSI